VPPVAQPSQACGASVAMKGGVLLVGCPGRGQVQVWDVSGASGQLATVFPANVSDGSSFGALVAFDGQRAAVYAPSDNEVGAFTVFEKQNLQSWSEIFKKSSVSGVASMTISGDRLAPRSPVQPAKRPCRSGRNPGRSSSWSRS
jgi:hypothetical protein